MYKNIDFLSPLVDAMTATDPSERPAAADALKRFKSIVSSQSYFTLRHRLVERKDTPGGHESDTFENIGILMNAALHPVKLVFRIPSQTVSVVRKLMSLRFSKAAMAT